MISRKNNFSALFKFDSISDILNNLPSNFIVGNTLLKAFKVINDAKYEKILCSISGGSDSDIVMDIIYRCDISNKVTYIFFDTGIEYEATKKHLDYLENKYNITIRRVRPKKPVPLAVKEYGVPFISKVVSENIHRLQFHNFTFTDESYDVLIKKYPDCQSALEWWCNLKGENSQYNIDNNIFLKEFLVANPPTFPIHHACCEYAKIKASEKIIKSEGFRLCITGVRAAEGGARKGAYTSCFDSNKEDYDRYRPVFFFKKEDKIFYEDTFNVKHSECYSLMGLKRTGCCGCPYGRNYKEELNAVKLYQPKLYNAIKTIFNASYEYTDLYRKFVNENKEKFKKAVSNQISIEDWLKESEEK